MNELTVTQCSIVTATCVIVCASPLLDMPIEIVTVIPRICSTVFETTLIVDGIAVAARLLLARWVVVESKPATVALCNKLARLI